jgi:cephalosporin hydroxylase
MRYKYKEKLCLKSPFEIGIYMKLLYDLKPKTIIEIGSREGGSALLFKDFAAIYNLDSQIYSVDINPVRDISVEGIQFLEGNVNRLEEVFNKDFFAKIPRPILVVEDSSHVYQDVLICLNFFAANLRKGDMIVIEDGILVDLGLEQRYDGGPNRAISEFFQKSPDVFQLATEYCDVYGQNTTYNPNGYLWKL